MPPDTRKCDKLSRKSFQKNLQENIQEDLQESFQEHFKEELSKLIRSNFPKLDAADISRAEEQFSEFNRAELEMLLYPGKIVTKRGKRVQAAYLRTAPVIYRLTKATAPGTDQYGQPDQIGQKGSGFHKWLLIASKASELSFSCFEGFFNSSVVILEKKGHEGLPLLEKWAEIGISLAEKSNQLAMIYFNLTASIIASPDFSASSTSTLSHNDISTESKDLENFREFISLGERFVSSNTRVAEAYFEHLPDMLALLSPEDFKLFYNIVDCLLNVQWAIAVDILAIAKNVFSSVPFQRRKELLVSLNEFTCCLNSCPYYTDKAIAVFSLFKNSPQVMEKLDDRDFREWESIAKEIANISVDAAISFLERSPRILMSLKINELHEWAEKGIISLSSKKEAFESFYVNSFRGMEKYIKSINGEEKELLLDTGAKIALINPGCTGSYFENSPVALRLLSENEFKVWVDTGARISKESSSLGSSYFKNSVTSFRKMPPSYYGEILEIAGSLFEKDWLLAGKFFENLPDAAEKMENRDIRKWADIGIRVYDADRNLAVDYFTYSPVLLAGLDVFELEEWALKGLETFKDNTSLGRPYFSLKSRGSNDFINELTGGVALNKVVNILRYYALGLSGASFKIRSKKELPDYNEAGPVNPVISGRTIYLEPKIKKYGNFQDNFKIYRLSVMHEVGHVQFSSLNFSQELLEELRNQISEKYRLKETGRAERTGKTEETESKKRVSEGVLSGNRNDISDIIAMFPNRVLAAGILGLLEDARVEYLIMDLYRGVRSDLESIRRQMLLSRPVPEGELEKLMEALLWLSASHEPPFKLSEDNRPLDNRPLVDTMRTILQNRVLQPDSSILTSLEATFAVYSLFEDFLGPLEHRKYEMLKNIEYRGMGLGSFGGEGSLTQKNHKDVIKSFIPESEDFPRIEKEQPDKERSEKEKLEKKPAYATDRNWKVLGSYRYDEWDYVMSDYRSDWCAVIEIEPVGGSGKYYTGASERYRNEIALIKNVFTRMKPESFHRLKGQTDGTEIDIDAFSDALIERRCGINPDEKLYVRWDKRKRDVATLFLIDVSASTRKGLRRRGGRIEERRNTEERRSIIDVEKDALVIMAQALETIGDKYAVYAFSGHTKEDVEYYIIKEFGEELSADVEKRISLLEPVANTRLGSAIRHSIKKLEQASARIKILVLLSDGEPYDTCYGEGAYQGKYAEEDTKMAIQEGNAQDIHFFCITVDSSPGDYLDKIFSNFGYTIIDDACILPERLPLLYKRLTT